MIAVAACWGLGYAALLVAAMMYGWQAAYHHFTRRAQPARQILKQTGRPLSTISAVLLWAGVAVRVATGYGWPVVSPTDGATMMGLLALSWYVAWSWLVPEQRSDLPASVVIVLLLSYGLSPFVSSPPIAATMSDAALASKALTLCAGSWLALAASSSLTMLVRTYQGYGEYGIEERSSEVFVRIALVCLAISLAVDTWWLQQVGLGNENDAQQAGIAVGWIVYFAALRLRASGRWRGWPWASVLIVGFACMLPILINVSWLEKTLIL